MEAYPNLSSSEEKPSPVYYYKSSSRRIRELFNNQKLTNELTWISTKYSVETLLTLSKQIEQELRRHLAAMGQLNGRFSITIRQGIREIARFGISNDLLESVDLFNSVRNAIVHGRIDPSEAELASAIDSGIKILTALQQLKRVRHIVSASNLRLFASPDGTAERERVVGVMIDEVLPTNEVGVSKVYPTPRRDYYHPGMEVSWDWYEGSFIGESWYRDPRTNELKGAFTRSAEFIGTNIEDI